MIFALSGLSECGKSTAGKYLDSRGVKRLKIVRFMKEVQEADGASAVPYGEWIEQARQHRRLWHMEQFTTRLLAYIEEAGHSAVSIESLYDPVLSAYLKERFGDRYAVLFIDIPREVRLQRQMIRENLNRLEEAVALLDPRDEVKAQWGALEVRAMADELVDNSGTVQDLYRALDSILVKYKVDT